MEDEVDQQSERFRRVHRGAFSSAKGRSIALILRDRGLFGGSCNSFPHRRRTLSNDDEHDEGGGDHHVERRRKTDDVGDRTTSTTTTTTTTGGVGTDQRRRPPPRSRRCHLNSSPVGTTSEIRHYGELCSVTRFRSSYLLGGDGDGDDGEPPPTTTVNAVSTISVAFSTDGSVLASTHGDHTVKITCCHSGRLLRTLEGHPRTPWTVKFHPKDRHVVASGCLGFQVKVWRWSTESARCVNMVRLSCAIISLAFHPTGHVLAVASGNSLYLWDYDDRSTGEEEEDKESGNDGGGVADRRLANHHHNHNPFNSGSSGGGNHHPPHRRSMFMIEIRHDYALRCVHFPPGGDSMIVGGVNPRSDVVGGLRIGGSMSFSLKLWDFNLSALVRRLRDRNRKDAVTNAVTFVDRALLYNDGGFDVSPCGRYLCACAEYWLPEGVDCATSITPVDDYLFDDADYYADDSTDTVMAEETDSNQQHESSNGVESSNRLDVANNDSLSSSIDTNTVTPPRPTIPPRDDDEDNASTSQHQRQQQQQRLDPQQQRQRQQQSSSVPVNQYPLTPPSQSRPAVPLSPPSPPGRRLVGGLARHPDRPRSGRPRADGCGAGGASSSPQFSSYAAGRHVPHVVTVSLEPHRLGCLLEAAPLDWTKASGVTCVKFSPSGEFLLLGYGVREQASTRGDDEDGHRTEEEDDDAEPCHPVTALYRIQGGMTHVSSMMSRDDDVNIARFHPHSGHGFVYGTKQGRVRILSPKPWNHLSRVNRQRS